MGPNPTYKILHSKGKLRKNKTKQKNKKKPMEEQKIALNGVNNKA